MLSSTAEFYKVCHDKAKCKLTLPRHDLSNCLLTFVAASSPPDDEIGPGIARHNAVFGI